MYGCLGVLLVDQCSYLVLVTQCGLVGKVPGAELYRINNALLVGMHSTPKPQDAAVDVAKLLSSGHFYFSMSTGGSGYTLLSCMQKQSQPQDQFCWYVSVGGLM